ncbi:hypothetical protein K1719_035284 [Acacia pycnantha]|nr:hypothetical protein K1719_035284 [Acacia pycnantha]
MPVEAVITSDILREATKVVAKIVGKPESYVMVLLNWNWILSERINENKLQRSYIAHNNEFSSFFASVKKTIYWRETCRIFSGLFKLSYVRIGSTGFKSPMGYYNAASQELIDNISSAVVDRCMVKRNKTLQYGREVTRDGQTEKTHEATNRVEQHRRILNALQSNIIPEKYSLAELSSLIQ